MNRVNAIFCRISFIELNVPPLALKKLYDMNSIIQTCYFNGSNVKTVSVHFHSWCPE